MSRPARKAALAVASLFPGLDVVAPEAPKTKPSATLADRLLADVHAERAEGAAQTAHAPGLGRLTLADLAAEAGKRATQAAAAAAGGPCVAVGCVELREAKYHFCGTHQAGLPHGAQTREFDARERGEAAHAAALAICVRLLATAEGRLVLRPGERAPWADPPEVAGRIERTLTEAGLRREESAKHGAAWYLDVPRYETAGRGEQRASAYASLYADTRQRLSWLSSDPGKVRMLRPSDIEDEAVRARIQAAEKAGAGNGSHVPLGPLLGADVDREFRAVIAAALKRYEDGGAEAPRRIDDEGRHVDAGGDGLDAGDGLIGAQRSAGGELDAPRAAAGGAEGRGDVGGCAGEVQACPWAGDPEPGAGYAAHREGGDPGGHDLPVVREPGERDLAGDAGAAPEGVDRNEDGDRLRDDGGAGGGGDRRVAEPEEDQDSGGCDPPVGDGGDPARAECAAPNVDHLDAAAERLMLAVLRGLERGQAEASNRRAEFLAFSAKLPAVAAEPDVDTGRPDAWGTRVSWHLELPKGVRCGDGGKGGRDKAKGKAAA